MSEHPNNNSENNSRTNSWIRLPILLSIALAGGIFIGAKLFGGASNSTDVIKSANKFRDILSYINNEYVDTVQVDQLTEEAISKMLEKLDPHSVYIPPKDIDLARAALEGDFEGVGIEFHVLKDTLIVVTPISGGPSEAVGLQAGDKILKVNEKPITNIKLTTQDVYKLLRGKKGTKVVVEILRRGLTKHLIFTITRDKIPTVSVDASFMVDAQTGYIKVSRFSQNTYLEFKGKLDMLIQKGMKRLVLDLRGNPGGYLDKATQMADEMLADNKMIVFTKSKSPRYNQELRAFQQGTFEKGPIIVLIDEGSASASEIVSGALQDNDRALIVGRRSFGKGLVQMPIPLPDNSELRLTISRYYTPSGRSIQKPYSKNGEDYSMDLYNRYKHGEFFFADSIKFNDSLKYKTLRGRTVYGGGGIMPDVFVPRDTSMYTGYLLDLYNKGVIREFCLDYYSIHKPELDAMSFETYKEKFDISESMLADLIKMAEKSEVKFQEKDYLKSKTYLKNELKATIARSVWKNEGFYPIHLEMDDMFKDALQLWPKAQLIESGKVKVTKTEKKK